eukprot:Sspe_Gene.80378::Locus_50729_Transcript_1_1_Confidence_1.000_Length_1872::g.80378::m.80378
MSLSTRLIHVLCRWHCVGAAPFLLGQRRTVTKGKQGKAKGQRRPAPPSQGQETSYRDMLNEMQGKYWAQPDTAMLYEDVIGQPTATVTEVLSAKGLPEDLAQIYIDWTTASGTNSRLPTEDFMRKVIEIGAKRLQLHSDAGDVEKTKQALREIIEVLLMLKEDTSDVPWAIAREAMLYCMAANRTLGHAGLKASLVILLEICTTQSEKCKEEGSLILARQAVELGSIEAYRVILDKVGSVPAVLQLLVTSERVADPVMREFLTPYVLRASGFVPGAETLLLNSAIDINNHPTASALVSRAHQLGTLPNLVAEMAQGLFDKAVLFFASNRNADAVRWMAKTRGLISEDRPPSREVQRLLHLAEGNIDELMKRVDYKDTAAIPAVVESIILRTKAFVEALMWAEHFATDAAWGALIARSISETEDLELACSIVRTSSLQKESPYLLCGTALLALRRGDRELALKTIQGMGRVRREGAQQGRVPARLLSALITEGSAALDGGDRVAVVITVAKMAWAESVELLPSAQHRLVELFLEFGDYSGAVTAVIGSQVLVKDIVDDAAGPVAAKGSDADVERLSAFLREKVRPGFPFPASLFLGSGGWGTCRVA